MEAMEPDADIPYISILFYASHGKIWKGLRTFRRFGRPLVAFQSCMAGAEHAGSRGGAKRWCPAKLRFRRHWQRLRSAKSGSETDETDETLKLDEVAMASAWDSILRDGKAVLLGCKYECMVVGFKAMNSGILGMHSCRFYQHCKSDQLSWMCCKMRRSRRHGWDGSLIPSAFAALCSSAANARIQHWKPSWKDTGYHMVSRIAYSLFCYRCVIQAWLMHRGAKIPRVQKKQLRLSVVMWRARLCAHDFPFRSVSGDLCFPGKRCCHVIFCPWPPSEHRRWFKAARKFAGAAAFVSRHWPLCSMPNATFKDFINTSYILANVIYRHLHLPLMRFVR